MCRRLEYVPRAERMDRYVYDDMLVTLHCRWHESDDATNQSLRASRL